MKYRGEIDGLRTIAVVPVVLFHAGFSMFSGGFVGVDVFFVISGYLITSILLDELEAGKFSIINFYERRMRRILPALFFVMGACLIPALLWLTPLDYKNFSQSLIATSAFSSNLLFWSESGYFDTEAELKPLLHTWSLAVEEQYYIFFPVFLALLWKWRGQRLFFPIITIVSVLSLVAAEWCIRNSPAAGFYLLPSRAWELLLGAGIARFQHGNVRAQATALRDLAAFAGLAMILAAITLFDETTPFPGLSAVLPAVGTALIIQFTDEGGRARALLGARPLVFMGLLSYSTYLWHQPLLAFAHYRNVEPLGVGFALALCVASVGLAYISWRFVEAPFRSRAATSRRTIFLVSGVGTAAFMAVGLAGHFANGFPARMDAASLKIDPAMASFAKRGDGWCFYSVDTNKSLAVGKGGFDCWLGAGRGAPQILLYGDSFAGQYEPFWDAIGKHQVLAVNPITTNWCYPASGEGFPGPRTSRGFAQCLLNRAYVHKNAARYRVIIVAANWGRILEDGAMPEIFAELEYLAGKTGLVVIMPSAPQFDTDVYNAYLRSRWYGKPFDIAALGTANDAPAIRAGTALARFASGHERMVYLERCTLFNRDGRCSNLDARGLPFNADKMHISVAAAQGIARSYLDQATSQSLLARIDAAVAR